MQKDLLAISFLILAGIKLTFLLENAIDITLYDESNYLYSGVNLIHNGFPHAEGAPLYVLWYCALSLFQPDRVELYYLNYRILSICVPLLMYLLLRKYRVPTPGAFLFSAYFLISFSNLPLWPKPSSLSLLIILISFIINTYIRSYSTSTLLMCMSALIASFVRPEIFLTCILLFLFYCVLIISQYRHIHIKKEIFPLLVFIILSSLLFTAFGFPAFVSEKGRSFMAFGQHFSINWVNWTHSDLNPLTNWMDIVTDNFGNIQTISEAFLASPLLFFKHMFSNIIEFPKTLTTLLFIHYNVIFPLTHKLLWIVEGFLFILIVMLYSFLVRGRWINDLRINFTGYKKIMAHFVCFIIPGVLSSLIFYPRGHYLLFLAVFIMVTLSLLVVKNIIGKNDYKHVLAAGSLVLALTPCLSDYQSIPVGKAGNENITTIKFIQSLNIKSKVYLLESEGGFHIYLGDNFVRVPEYDKKTNFFDFLKKKQINMIVLSDTLKYDKRFAGDKEWNLFLQNYSTLSYKKLLIPHTKRAVFVKVNIPG